MKTGITCQIRGNSIFAGMLLTIQQVKHRNIKHAWTMIKCIEYFFLTVYVQHN